MIRFFTTDSKFSILFSKPKQVIIRIITCFSIFGSIWYLINLSWRKWLDPQIDFGRELYVSWRLSAGDVLFKDFEDWYGPLARFYDHILFSFFGPSIMLLAGFNFLIYLACLYLIYDILKKGWGYLPSLIGCLVFIYVFSFSQLTGISNYNFITPYTQSVNLGFFVSLLLVKVLISETYKTNRSKDYIIGIVFGFSLILKPEFIFADTCTTLMWIYLEFNFTRNYLQRIFRIGSGVFIPSGLTFFYFLTYEKISLAINHSCNAWIGILVLTRNTMISNGNKGLLGTDMPLVNLISHVNYTIMAIGFIGFIWGICKMIDKPSFSGYKFILTSILLAVVVFVSWIIIPWSSIGKCFLGILLLSLIYLIYIYRKDYNTTSSISLSFRAKLLFTVLSIALMARMFLNGRVFHYGFFQSSLAAVCISVLFLIEPVKYIKQKFTVIVYQFCIIIILTLGTVTLVRTSSKMYSYKTFSIGTSHDQFYTYPQQMQGIGFIVDHFSKLLIIRPASETLLVAPEGLMINYLAKKKSPVTYTDCIPRGKDGDAELIRQLDLNPPNWILMMSRDLREFGITRYGIEPGKGLELMNWIKTRYNKYEQFGGDPFDNTQVGGILLKRLK